MPGGVSEARRLVVRHTHTHTYASSLTLWHGLSDSAILPLIALRHLFSAAEPLPIPLHHALGPWPTLSRF